jgi:hypothetical protein
MKVKIVKDLELPPSFKSLKRIENLAQKYPNAVLKQGYINKKTESLFFKWKQRYFALTSQKLYFFEDNKKLKTVGCVNLKVLPARVTKFDGHFVVDFMGECESMVLKCQNKRENDEWVSIINEVLQLHVK